MRRSRRRFWKSESDDADKLAAYHTLYEALVTLAKLIAPFTPFIAEELYQNLVRSATRAAPESVHLCAWPVGRRAGFDAPLSFDMAAARRIVELGRAARNAAAVKTRQPLAEVVVATPAAESCAVERLRDVVMDELNVKELRFVGDGAELVAYMVKPNLQRARRLSWASGSAPCRRRCKEADGAALVAELRPGGRRRALPGRRGAQSRGGGAPRRDRLAQGLPGRERRWPHRGRSRRTVDEALREEGAGARARPRHSARAQELPTYASRTPSA